LKQWRSTISPISTKQRKLKQRWSTISSISTKQTRKIETVKVYHFTNINKKKESLKSDGQQFHQYQQNKRTFKQWWSTISPISTKQTRKIETVMVNNFTNINKTKESLKSDGKQFYQYQIH
jgi:hypothetical protein